MEEHLSAPAVSSQPEVTRWPSWLIAPLPITPRSGAGAVGRNAARRTLDSRGLIQKHRCRSFLSRYLYLEPDLLNRGPFIQSWARPAKSGPFLPRPLYPVSIPFIFIRPQSSPLTRTQDQAEYSCRGQPASTAESRATAISRPAFRKRARGRSFWFVAGIEKK